ncbi:hypothetical protein LQW54_009664 [Pestalotiopsis sp. IQ-011]
MTFPETGTTNTTLPPSHPDLHKHPKVPLPAGHPEASQADAQQCPVLAKNVKQPKSQAMDDKICPVVGTATTILPPDHPSTANASEGDVCPVTKATVGHHKDKVSEHPSVAGAEADAVCPVTGAKGPAH